MRAYRYFRLSEFDSRDEPGSGRKMDEDFLEALDEARHAARTPFRIVSGYRSRPHNERVGGVPDSAHTRGIAADISYTSKEQLGRILFGVVRAGFVRIGIGESFVHVDSDSSKPMPAFWDYSRATHVA